MSTATRLAQPVPLAASAAFRTFALVFALATLVLYVACDMLNWPLFTYRPGTGRVDLGFAPPVRDEGPAMYWYGWTASTLLGSALLGFGATLLPRRLTRRIPLALTWIAPLAALPVLVYSLRYFWRW